MIFGSSPAATTALRIAARSATPGTPVKSCISTRAGRYAISSAGGGVTAQLPSALMSSLRTVLPSSNRNRFSSRIFSDIGNRLTAPTPACSAAGRLK
jgi:hypothetical protein